MARGAPGSVLRRLDTLFTTGTVTGLADGPLLERFVDRGDEAAFEAIVARHGPMVWGICRRTLRDPNDAEDAFQATFLIFARRAGAIRQGDRLGGWLHGVAFKLSRRAKAIASRTTTLAEHFDAPDSPEPKTLEKLEQIALLHEEIERLPGKYREPIVLCHLEGHTHDEAAAQLGWPLGTVRGRLARGRDKLRDRLVRRGFDLSCVEAAPIIIPDVLRSRTVSAAIRFAAGDSASRLISAQAAGWVSWGLQAMFIQAWKYAAIALTTIGVASAGAGAFALAQGSGAKNASRESPLPEPQVKTSAGSVSSPLKKTEAEKPRHDSPKTQEKDVEQVDARARYIQLLDLKANMNSLQAQVNVNQQHLENVTEQLGAFRRYLAGEANGLPVPLQPGKTAEEVAKGLQVYREQILDRLFIAQSKLTKLQNQLRALEEPEQQSKVQQKLNDAEEMVELETEIELLEDTLEFSKESMSLRRRQIAELKDYLERPDLSDPKTFDQAQVKMSKSDYDTRNRALAELTKSYLEGRRELSRKKSRLDTLRRENGLGPTAVAETSNLERRLTRIEASIEALRSDPNRTPNTQRKSRSTR